MARRFKTLIAQGEIDEWESARRWRMLTGQGRPPTNVAETFERWRLRVVRKRSTTGGESREWFDAVLDPRLEATIAEHRFDLLVIDPWAVYYAGAENSNDETEAALDKLRDLAMRYSLAVLILHHLGKATDAREPEDLWRGASRLADWAGTRITLLPHYTDNQAERQGMTRQQARRYVDVKFLRRSTPTEDFSMVLDGESGWWARWAAPQDAADGRRTHLGVPDVVDALKASGGTWQSQNQAAEKLGVAEETAGKLLSSAVRAGAVETAKGSRRAKILLPSRHPATPGRSRVSAGRRLRRGARHGVLYVGPEIIEDATVELKNALALRCAANLSGGCPACGATFELDQPPRAGEVATARMVHENGCPVLLTVGEQ